MAKRARHPTKQAGVSVRKAVNAKCKDCSWDPAAPGTWKVQIQCCPCIECPLWPIRPVSESGEPNRALLDALEEDMPEELVRRIWADPFDPSPWREARQRNEEARSR